VVSQYDRAATLLRPHQTVTPTLPPANRRRISPPGDGRRGGQPGAIQLMSSRASGHARFSTKAHHRQRHSLLPLCSGAGTSRRLAERFLQRARLAGHKRQRGPHQKRCGYRRRRGPHVPYVPMKTAKPYPVLLPANGNGGDGVAGSAAAGTRFQCAGHCSEERCLPRNDAW